MSDTKLAVTVTGNTIHVGPDFMLSIHRTLRVPDDGKVYPLPASLGLFPIYKVDDYRDTVPASWLDHGGVFFPMWQREAAWLAFSGCYMRPQAALIAAGKVCAITGKKWDGKLHTEQNYVVVGGPNGQPWLDGFKTKDGRVSQFVAMPLGQGYTVEKQVTGEESFGGLQVQVFPSKAERHLPQPTPQRVMRGAGGQSAGGMFGDTGKLYSMASSNSAGPQFLCSAGPVGQHLNCSRPTEQAAEMGLAAGGTITQKIYDAGVWTPDAFEPTSGRVFVHIVNSQMFAQITGEQPPSSPVTRAAYEQHNYPWFALYDEHLSDVAAGDVLGAVKTVTQIDGEKGFSGQMDNASIDPKNVIKYGNPDQVRDGSW